MTYSCAGNWRCRRLCKVGRTSTRRRPLGCKFLTLGLARHREKSSTAESVGSMEKAKKAISPKDAARTLPAE